MMHELWYIFSRWHPVLLFLIVVLVILYRFAMQLRALSAEESRSRKYMSFGIYLLVLYLCLGSPLDYSAQNTSFVAFVFQTILMTLVMPWVLLRSLPQWMFSALLGIHWLYRVWKFCTNPFVAPMLYTFVSVSLLVPPVFSLALQVNWFHIVSQFALMLASIWLWWPLANPSKELPALGKGTQLLYILLGSNLMMPVPVLLIIAQHPWYGFYSHVLHDSYGTLLAGQQRGAILMIVGMAAVYGVRAMTTFVSYDGRSWYE